MEYAQCQWTTSNARYASEFARVADEQVRRWIDEYYLKDFSSLVAKHRSLKRGTCKYGRIFLIDLSTRSSRDAISLSDEIGSWLDS